MASFDRQRCHASILFLLVVSTMGSPSGTSLRSLKARMRAEAINSSTTTPPNPMETSTETVNQSETSSLIYSASTIQPSLSEQTEESQKFGNEEQQKWLNISTSEDITSWPQTRSTPEYRQNQQKVSITRRPGGSTSAPRAPTPPTNRETSTPTAVIDQETEDSIGSEIEGNRIFHAKDLLTPFPRSVSFLAQLMSLSMQNLDTAFRGNTRDQPQVTQYYHSFRTTLLQICQKLSNAYMVSTTNADKINMHSIFVPSKVREATGYLEKSENSRKMAEFLYLPLKNLKETTDQTFNLSSQIATQFGDLVQLVDEVVTSHNSSKLNKETQIRDASSKLQWTNQEKKRLERKIISIENEIKELKRKKQFEETEFNSASDDLNLLKKNEADESQCYWAWNWKFFRYDWYCPNKPHPSQIQQSNQKASTAQRKLVTTMKSLTAKEEEAAKEREDDNELLIRVESVSNFIEQVNKDMTLLENTSGPLNQLWTNLRKLSEKWKEFVSICGAIQDATKNSLDIIEEVNHTSTHWNIQLTETMLSYLNKTKEDLSLVKNVIDIYLEGSSEHLGEIVVEVEQMMTKRENPMELESNIRKKCEIASHEIQNLKERNKGPIKKSSLLTNSKRVRRSF